ncbi:hypothetical protein GM541_12875, partial [Streptococcus pneumoniae]|nr:hypothetical protein [Streptococcus pneumoniae]MTW37948.1 hypothetical protein [Streptococcus pneumoniae]
MGLFFYNKIGSIISIGDLPTTNIIEPKIICKESRKSLGFFIFPSLGNRSLLLF